MMRNFVPKNLDMGGKVRRVREILGIKQMALAIHLKMKQQDVSRMEKRGHIDPVTMQAIAQLYGINELAIIHFNEAILPELMENLILYTISPEKLPCNCQKILKKAVNIYERIEGIVNENPEAPEVKLT